MSKEETLQGGEVSWPWKMLRQQWAEELPPEKHIPQPGQIRSSPQPPNNSMKDGLLSVRPKLLGHGDGLTTHP